MTEKSFLQVITAFLNPDKFIEETIDSAFARRPQLIYHMKEGYDYYNHRYEAVISERGVRQP